MACDACASRLPSGGCRGLQMIEMRDLQKENFDDWI